MLSPVHDWVCSSILNIKVHRKIGRFDKDNQELEHVEDTTLLHQHKFTALFLVHTEGAQHLSAENGQHCPLQIRHLDLDSALLVAKGPSNIERRAFGISCNQSSS